MTSFRNLVFAKSATNTYGQFQKGDRAQGRFPKELTESYLRHGILVQSDEPVSLDKPVKDYSPKSPRKRATKTTK